MRKLSHGSIFNIQRYAIHDGPGIRTTVFLQGCPLRCWWCHNPESQQPVDAPNIIKGNTGVITSIRRMTNTALLREIEKDVVFFDESGGGVTFSGGEPLMQPEFLVSMLQQCAAQDIHTVIDTSGYVPSEIFQSILAHVDFVLYDIKLIDDAAHHSYTGVSNHQILENLRLLSESGIPYSIRFPVIPGITDTPGNIDAVLTLLDDLRGIQHINLLPYHRIAAHKYERLGQEYRMNAVEVPTEAVMQALQHVFERRGFRVVQGAAMIQIHIRTDENPSVTWAESVCWEC